MKKTEHQDPAIKAKFNDTLSLVDATVRSIRRIATELRPSIIDDLGLNAAMEWLVSEFNSRQHIDIRYEIDFDDKNINPDISIGLFRILQESLTNIARHANAKTALITIEKLKDTARLTIQDDGIGFDTTVKQNKVSFGLLGIKERTGMMHGECSIVSAPGKGTTIEVKIPLDQTIK
jgi:signal transduction histidine kinase